MNYPPSVSLALLPTRIEMLSRLSSQVGGLKLFIKRDDETGCLTSGNKIRKLEFVLADALSKKADTLITCGGIESNHARATAAVATRYGLNSILFLKGEHPDSLEGNFWLDRLLGAEIHRITEDEYDEIDRMMEVEADKQKSKGRTPYVIPEGASNWLGAMGYLKASEELRNQLDGAGLKIDRIVFACGSGGTYAGLLIGKKIFGINARLTGINVCQTPAHFKSKIQSICREADARLRLGLSFESDEIEIIGGYVREGYARTDTDVSNLICRVAGTEGIILDPVYTGKAMYGLLDLISKGEIARESNILFLHTGGIFSLFAYRRIISPNA